MKTFRFEVWYSGCGAECLSYTETYTVKAASKRAAQKALAKDLGCSLSFVDEGEDCTITEIAA